MSKGADFNKDEKLMARRDGATLIKNSGRGEVKGDAKKGNLLIDYKFTEAQSFSVNKKEFAKLDMDAYNQGLTPAMVIIFDNTTRYAVLDWSSVLEMQEELTHCRQELDDTRAHLDEIRYARGY